MRSYEVFNDTLIYRLLKIILLSMMNIYIVHVYLEYNMLSTNSALWNTCAVEEFIMIIIISNCFHFIICDFILFLQTDTYKLSYFPVCI